MARRSGGGRGAYDTASMVADLLLGTPLPSLSYAAQEDPPDPDDRRQFHPEGAFRSPRGFYTGDARSKISQRAYRSAADPIRRHRYLMSLGAEQQAFTVPSRLMVCVRRKVRREVLHAKREAGRGGMRRPRRNFLSSISCRG